MSGNVAALTLILGAALLAGWVDANGNVLRLPAAPTAYDNSSFFKREVPRVWYPLPTAEWLNPFHN